MADILKEQLQTDYLDSLGLKKNVGYYILSETPGRVVGFSPTQPDHVVIWDRAVNGGYVNGRYGNTLNLFEIADLRFLGLDMSYVLDVFKNIGFDYNEQPLENNFNSIVLKGYTDTWSSVDSKDIGKNKYMLMENDVWGDETQYLIINDKAEVILDDVYNGFDEDGLTEALTEYWHTHDTNDELHEFLGISEAEFDVLFSSEIREFIANTNANKSENLLIFGKNGPGRKIDASTTDKSLANRLTQAKEETVSTKTENKNMHQQHSL